jgi:hypothetical protein
MRKVEFTSQIVQISDRKFAVAVTAVVPTADEALEMRKWVEGAIHTAAKESKRGTELIIPVTFK